MIVVFPDHNHLLFSVSQQSRALFFKFKKEEIKFRLCGLGGGYLSKVYLQAVKHMVFKHSSILLTFPTMMLLLWILLIIFVCLCYTVVSVTCSLVITFRKRLTH